MRMSQLFGQTLRQAPAEVEAAGHRLLLRAGFVRQLGAGIFSYLPLGWRTAAKIQGIIREEMERIGAQEMQMPVVNPADLWKATGRWASTGPELTRFFDRNGRELVLAMTHEESVAALVRQEIQSYRHLPRILYHLQTKWRDDPRPRAGLIRVREFIMKDSYSLDADQAGLDQQYDRHFAAYQRIFARCGLPVAAVESDVGMMGGLGAHEFIYYSPIGEDTIMVCPSCGCSANRQIASFRRQAPDAESPLPVEEVATPGTSTIGDLAALLGIPPSRTAKAVFMTGEGDDGRSCLVFALIRGDLEVNEAKLAAATGLRALRPAVEEEIRAAGAVPGYASPVGLRAPRPAAAVLVIADLSIRDSPNLVGGANREGYHLRNLNLGRDFEAAVVADIASASAGSPCPACGAPLEERRGVEVGNIFKLGTRYSDAVGCTFLDESGRPRPVVMGSYGIGVGRLLACVAEEHHDGNGLLWPVTVAPYEVHLVALKGGEAQADRLCGELEERGVEVLYDDRGESPGVMFTDADLIGCPLRMTVSRKSLDAGGVETRLRSERERGIAGRGEAAAWARSTLDAMRSALESAAERRA